MILVLELSVFAQLRAGGTQRGWRLPLPRKPTSQVEADELNSDEAVTEIPTATGQIAPMPAFLMSASMRMRGEALHDRLEALDG